MNNYLNFSDLLRAHNFTLDLMVSTLHDPDFYKTVHSQSVLENTWFYFWWNILHTVLNYGGNVPELSAESLCLHQGMATGGRWCPCSVQASLKGGLDWTGTLAWTTQLSASNRCHQIQKGHVTPTATSCHLLMKAERFCRKFGNFFHHNLTLCAECFIRNYVSRVHKHSLPNLILCLDFSKQSENCDWLKIWLGSKLWLCTLRTPIQLRLWFIYAHLGRVPTDMMT